MAVKKKLMKKRTAAVPVARSLAEELATMFSPVITRLDVLIAQGSEVIGQLAKQPQDVKVDLLQKLVIGQEALTQTIILLTAKGVEKASRKKADPPPQPMHEKNDDEEAQKKIAADAAARAAREPDPEPKKQPDLKVVPDQKDAALSAEDVRALFLDFHAKHDRAAAEKLLADFGAKKFSEVPPHQFAAFAEKCRAG